MQSKQLHKKIILSKAHVETGARLILKPWIYPDYLGIFSLDLPMNNVLFASCILCFVLEALIVAYAIKFISIQVK